MVCCFSMVQRVLARQTNSKKSASDCRNTASSSGSVDPSKGNSSIINSSSVVDSDPLPARAVTSGEAAETVWKYLNTIPSLMEVGIEMEGKKKDTYKHVTFN